MSPEQILSQYGPLGMMAILLGVIVKWLLSHVDSLVKTNKEISIAFSETMNNHLNENTKALTELMTLVKNLNGRLKGG